MAAYTVNVTVNSGGLISLENASGSAGESSGSPLNLNPGDTVTFQRYSIVSGKSATISGLSIFTSNSNFTITAFAGSPVTRTVATGAATSDTITGTSSDSDVDSFYFQRAAGSIVAPIINDTSFTYYNNQPRALYSTGSSWFVRTTINLLSNGLGGTLEYGRNTSSDSVSGASWQTDGTTYSFPAYDTPVTNNANTWNHLLGQTRYFYASQDRATSGAFDSTGGVLYDYVTPNTVTVSNSDVAVGATSYVFTLTNCTTDYGGYLNRGAEVYSVSTTDHGSGEISVATVAGSRFTSIASTGSSTLTGTVDNTNLPANTAGSTETYYVYAYRRNDWSGKQVYIKTDSFTLTRVAGGGISDYGIEVYDTTNGTKVVEPGIRFGVVIASSTNVTLNSSTTFIDFLMDMTGISASTVSIVEISSTWSNVGDYADRFDFQSDRIRINKPSNTDFYGDIYIIRF